MPGNGISVMTTKTVTNIFYLCVLNVGLNFIKIRNLYFEFLLTRSRTKTFTVIGN